jgi:hypothetical protein
MLRDDVARRGTGTGTGAAEGPDDGMIMDTGYEFTIPRLLE